LEDVKFRCDNDERANGRGNTSSALQRWFNGYNSKGDMNKLIKQRVTAILLKFPETMDNDRELIVRYWKQQITDEQDEARMDLQSIPYYTLDAFFASFMTGKFEHPDTITRVRRRIQEEYPHLRGAKYNERHKHQEKVKEELGYGKALDDSRGGHTP
jgi:hypothetical protein